MIRRGTDRQLLMLTPRDPYSAPPQSFNPSFVRLPIVLVGN